MAQRTLRPKAKALNLKPKLPKPYVMQNLGRLNRKQVQTDSGGLVLPGQP